MRLKITRALGLAVAAVLAVVAGVVVLVHLPPVQRASWEWVAGAVGEATGWQVEATGFRARLWPAAVELLGVRVGAPEPGAIAADRVAIRLRWRDLLSSPRRISAIEVDGLAIDLRRLQLPQAEADPGQPVRDPWRVVEIGSLEVRGARIGAAAAGVDVELDGLELAGEVVGGEARITARIGTIGALRDGRRLVVGPLELAATADEGGVRVERLDFEGAAASGSVTASAGFAERQLHGEGRIELELGPAAEWFDPDLAVLLRPSGRLVMTGAVAASPGADPTVAVEHAGGPLGIAGYEIARLRLASAANGLVLEAMGADWGEAAVELARDLAVVHARLADAAVGPAAALSAAPLPAWLPGPLAVSGVLDATVPLPVAVKDLVASADLRVAFPGGWLELEAEGGGMNWRARRLALEVPGAAVGGEGRVSVGDGLSGTLRATVSEPAVFAGYLAKWAPEVDALAIGGGPAALSLELSGTLDRPGIDASFGWDRPTASTIAMDRIEGFARGGLDELEWGMTAVPVSGSAVELAGVAQPRQQRAAGTWKLQLPEVAAAAALADRSLADRVGGSVAGDGAFVWDGGGAWSVGGVLRAEELRFDEWAIESAAAEVELSPMAAELRRLELHALGGSVSGALLASLGGPERPIEGRLAWRGLDPSTLPLDLPEAARGSLDGWLEVAGSVEHPAGELELRWSSAGSDPVAAGALRAVLAGGEVDLTSDGLTTAAGPLAVAGRVPLGDLPRPAWLWPEAPGGPVELTVSGRQLELTALAAALQGGPLPVQVSSDLSLELSWDLVDPARRFGQLALDGASLRHAGGVISAPDGVRLNLDRGLLRLDRTRLVGLRGGLELAGEVDTVARTVRFELAGELMPEIAQLIPYPVRIDAPITLRASVEGPLAAPEGTIVVDHRGGSIVWRDPPVELSDLQLQAELGGGELLIRDGSVGINRGRALFGGGWDRASGQGIVIELDQVTFYAAGTLTQWSGLLAVEPDPERIARVSGELVLAGGIWEQRADLAGTLLSGPDLIATVDDPLHGIALDLTVRAQTGVLVNNNLGRFDVSWDRLRVGGTAAAPALVGDIRIAPGGVVRLPGKTVELQRGSLRFTGDPQVDPVVELVPVEDLAVFGEEGSSSSSLDVYSLAAEGLYGGIGRALGFENETLQPVEIAVETETDTSSQILLGQRLGSNLAFFFAANPSDVRDRTTLLQLWNFDFAPGLAAQGYQSVADESSGVTLIQRFRWGGSVRPTGLASFIAPFRDSDGDDDRPVIRRLRFEGEWPLSKRRLRRATGLSKGQPYDPFLAFVAEVHLEQELRVAGYPEARVRSRAEGSERSPVLAFSFETGPRYDIAFVGDNPPKAVCREVLALYMPPPLEEQALANMKLALRRHYQATGHPFAEVAARREGDLLELVIEPGEALTYRGPVVEGVDERRAVLIRELLDSPLELAAAVEDPERASALVSRQLAALGYPDARVVELAASEPRDGVSEVRLSVAAGERVQIAEVEVTGYDPLGLTGQLGDALAVGAPLDRRAIDNQIAEIRRAYQRSGYDQVSVRAVLGRTANGEGRVEIQMDPGLQRRLDEVRFTGLRHIDPRHLRAGLELSDGDLLDVFAIDSSAIAIANFAPVDRVQVATIHSPAGGSIVEMEVDEKPRWTVELGAGWDSERGFEARTGLRDDNLFGRGASANLRLRWSDSEKVALLFGSLPPLPRGRTTIGTTLSLSERDRELVIGGGIAPYVELENEASLDLIYELTPRATLKPYVRYGLNRREFEEPYTAADQEVATVTLGGAAFLDRLDNPFDPHRGFSLVADAGWSSSYFGSDLDTLRTMVSGSLAATPWSGWTWVQTGRIGVAEPLRGTELDPTVRFFAGGQGSIRGFDFESVGPWVESGEGTARALGGGGLFILNEELRTPLWKSLRGAVFVDTGQIWESWSVADWRLSTSVGLGLRWSTPVGLIWADAAWPVANVGISSRDPKFYFGIGRPF